MGSAQILLINPKHAHNVGTALRAAAVFGANSLYWSGDRVGDKADEGNGWRLPREERLKEYKHVHRGRVQDSAPFIMVDQAAKHGMTPVAVEIVDDAEDLAEFEHPEDAIYIFGPEDGDLPKSIRSVAHRFVRIPAAPGVRTPLNLASAVNIILYDRLVKENQA